MGNQVSGLAFQQTFLSTVRSARPTCAGAASHTFRKKRRAERSHHGFGAAEAGLRSAMGGTGLEPVTPSYDSWGSNCDPLLAPQEVDTEPGGIRRRFVCTRA